jgi:hypothetical protein
MNALILQFKKVTPLCFVFIAIGCFALVPNAQADLPPPDGDYPGENTAEGQSALFSLTTGTSNTAVGFFSLHDNTTGSFNTAIGARALISNINGEENTALGRSALRDNTDGGRNTAIGVGSLAENTSGSFNTAVGRSALKNNTTANDNAALGFNALGLNSIGTSNTALGKNALALNANGNSNTGVGFRAGNAVTTASNVICIGANVFGDNLDNSCYIGSIFGQTSPGGTAVFVNSNGKLGTAPSSRRFKEEIKPMDKASEALFSLKPVSFHYKKEIDPAGTPQFGLVAEEVEKVNPDLVVRDKDGKTYSVRYEQVNAMLLNEFLKEHQAFLDERNKVQQLEANAARQQKQIEALAAGLQKVSVAIETSKAAPHVVANRN